MLLCGALHRMQTKLQRQERMENPSMITRKTHCKCWTQCWEGYRKERAWEEQGQEVQHMPTLSGHSWGVTGAGLADCSVQTLWQRPLISLCLLTGWHLLIFMASVFDAVPGSQQSPVNIFILFHWTNGRINNGINTGIAKVENGFLVLFLWKGALALLLEPPFLTCKRVKLSYKSLHP